MNIEQLLQAMSDELDGESETMKLLSQISESAVFEHAANKNFAMSGNNIPPKYKLLISIAVSAAIGSERCTETYTRVAGNKKITNEEIMEALLVARFVAATSVISVSTSSIKMMLKK